MHINWKPHFITFFFRCFKFRTFIVNERFYTFSNLAEFSYLIHLKMIITVFLHLSLVQSLLKPLRRILTKMRNFKLIFRSLWTFGISNTFFFRNHFINLCHHEEDFGIKIMSYNFFATSHGKSVCDGIGALAKRTARKASLKGVTILTSEQMYNYLNDNVAGIRCIHLLIL